MQSSLGKQTYRRLVAAAGGVVVELRVQSNSLSRKPDARFTIVTLTHSAQPATQEHIAEHPERAEWSRPMTMAVKAVPVSKAACTT